MNQRELIGLLRVVRDLRATTSKGLQLIRDTLSYLVRTHLDKTFPAEIACLAEVWDDCLYQL